MHSCRSSPPRSHILSSPTKATPVKREKTHLPQCLSKSSDRPAKNSRQDSRLTVTHPYPCKQVKLWTQTVRHSISTNQRPSTRPPQPWPRFQSSKKRRCPRSRWTPATGRSTPGLHSGPTLCATPSSPSTSSQRERTKSWPQTKSFPSNKAAEQINPMS